MRQRLPAALRERDYARLVGALVAMGFGREMVLVAVSLDPHKPQSADIEIPLWEFGLPDDGAFLVDDLVGEAFVTIWPISHIGGF